MSKARRNLQKRIGRASDEALFAQMIFYGVTLLGRSEREVWLMPLGALLDQWEVYKQFNGITKTTEESYIDSVIPTGT